MGGSNSLARLLEPFLKILKQSPQLTVSTCCYFINSTVQISSRWDRSASKWSDYCTCRDSLEFQVVESRLPIMYTWSFMPSNINQIWDGKSTCVTIHMDISVAICLLCLFKRRMSFFLCDELSSLTEVRTPCAKILLASLHRCPQTSTMSSLAGGIGCGGPTWSDCWDAENCKCTDCFTSASDCSCDLWASPSAQGICGKVWHCQQAQWPQTGSWGNSICHCQETLWRSSASLPAEFSVLASFNKHSLQAELQDQQIS